jgi:hypothetical protein
VALPVIGKFQIVKKKIVIGKWCFVMSGEVNTKAVKLSISLPANILEMVDAECEALGIGRSTYIKLAVMSKVRADQMLKDAPGRMVQAYEMMTFLRDLDQRGLLQNGATDSVD